MVLIWPVLIATLIGAAGLWLVLARTDRPMRLLGAVLGLGSLAFILAQATRIGQGIELPETVADADAFLGERPPLLFYVFALIAIGAAGRMITHHRPVYSALYFVLVVLSSAAIFLYLEAEFMAFALVIVYAGAILITYLFVLMLAQQVPSAEDGEGEQTPEYDRIPREPAVAVFAGFLIIALLGQLIFNGPNQLPGAPSAEVRMVDRINELNNMTEKRRGLIEMFRDAGTDLPLGSDLAAVREDTVAFLAPPDDRWTEISYEDAGVSRDEVLAILPQNIETVGWALVHTFPVSLELAGVILLMAMFGAVVLARKQIELSEDEKRAAAGMARLSVEPEGAAGGGGGGA